jgi:hypothetical protein
MLTAFENSTVHGFPSVCLLLPDNFSALGTWDKIAR